MVTDPGGRPETRYVETELGYLAYQTFGQGERTIFFVTGALTNLDAIWDEPSALRFFDRLRAMGRVVMYDMRGSGVSDPIPGSSKWLPIEQNVDDLRAVLDAAEVEQAVVYGDTEGGLSAMLLAAVDPRRVSALVLVSSAARLLRADDYPIGLPPETAQALSDLYVSQHGTTGAMLELTAPSVFDDPRFVSWWTRYQRLSVPLGLVKSTFEWFGEVDVRAALPLIQAPTLVIGKRDARFHRATFSEYLAENIAGAELRVLEGADTLPFHAGDFSQTLDEVEEFLTGNRRIAPSDRVLSTVLFTDIVESTALAAAIGDERWLDRLAEHNRIVRSQIDRFGGRQAANTGDGVVATFEGPARAVVCAISIIEQLRPIGLEARAGIHTGEVEFRDGAIGGLAVHIAARVMAIAADGGVVVSPTVKDLVAGSGIEFTDAGTHRLKGVPGDWPLYRVVSVP